jgi:tRNA 2-thiouridine synthesizing protein D
LRKPWPLVGAFSFQRDAYGDFSNVKFTIVIYSAPCSSQAATSAWQFCNALLEGGHSIYRLFFYHDGVHNNSQLSVPPQDEINLPLQWDKLIRQHQIDAVSCVSSALKRGVLNATEAKRHEKNCHNLSDATELSGLGQLIDACMVSDRVVCFGA